MRQRRWRHDSVLLADTSSHCNCLSAPIPTCSCQTSSRRQSALMWYPGIYLEVVNISLCPHHHFTGWDRLAAGAARPTVPEQSANTKTQIVQSVRPPKSKRSSLLSSSSFLLRYLFLPLTWCSHSDTESCPLCCSRWCQCPPAGLGSRSIWGSECASSAPWKRAGSDQQSFLHILHTTWRQAEHLTSGCSPCWCGSSQAPGRRGQRFDSWDRCRSQTQLDSHFYHLLFLRQYEQTACNMSDVIVFINNYDEKKKKDVKSIYFMNYFNRLLQLVINKSSLLKTTQLTYDYTNIHWASAWKHVHFKTCHR